MLLRLALGLAGIVGLAGAASAAGACQKVVATTEVVARWYNPHPDPDDYVLPMPGGLRLVFVPVQLGASGLYGNEKSTYTMGANPPRLFETPLEVRVGSPIAGGDGKATLLVGKYELSKGQYVSILGEGDIAKGIGILIQRSLDPRVAEELGDYATEFDASKTRNPCYHVLTSAVVEFLSEPITFLSYKDYIEVVDSYNLFCIQRRDCRERLSSLGPNPDFPAFVRLPAEHEWEFIARGGRDFAAGKLTKAALQADSPFLPAGSSLKDFAHIGSDPQRLLPIGSKSKLFGFYDVLGNAEELMQNPFTAENGFGAVGAYVARGGHFRLKADEIRVSRRVELAVFRRDDETKQFVRQYFPNTGIRVAIGLPIAGSINRTGSSELADQFAASYATVDESGDNAGASFADAKDLGRLGPTATRAAETLDGTDVADFYAFTVPEYAATVIEGAAASPARILVVDEADKVYLQQEVRTSAPVKLTTPNLIPGRYFLKVLAPPGAKTENRYDLKLAKVPAPDTGVARPDSSAFAQAVRLTRGSVHNASGFVGAGDRSDTYPIVSDGSDGGLVITLSGQSAALKVAFLNERLETVAERTSQGAEAVSLPVPVAGSQRGFVQVSSDGGASTLYSVSFLSKKLYDPAFVARFTEASLSNADADKPYLGYLGGKMDRLYLGLRVPDRAKLRVELSDLASDIDLTVFSATNSRVDSSHNRTGNAAEYFEKDVDAGDYVLQLTLKDRNEVSPFKVMYSLAEPSVAGPGDPAAAKANAQTIPNIATGPQYFSDSSENGEIKYFVFDVNDTNGFVRADVSGIDAKADFDLFLEDVSGNILAKSVNTGAADESIGAAVTYGRYFLRLQPAGRLPYAYFSLVASVTTQMAEPNLDGFGTLIESNDSWMVYKKDNECWMITVAESVSPELGWRQEKPYFSIGVERGDASVWIALDRASQEAGDDLYQSNSLAAYVITSGGDYRKIPAEFQTYWMKPLMQCSTGTCVDDSAIRGFRRGSKLEINGNKPGSGEAVSVMYSLRGYTRSAQRINSLCNGKANWIWNK